MGIGRKSNDKTFQIFHRMDVKNLQTRTNTQLNSKKIKYIWKVDENLVQFTSGMD